jgi:seryl-tRNA synthetase
LLATKSLVANGYLHDFPHHALFAAPVKHDLRALQAVADIRQVSSEDFYQFNDYLGAPDQILAPTVCYHCFEAFRDRQFDKPEVLITALGQCHRFESKNLKDLRRLKHFRMRNWNVQFRLVTANDPFFLAESDRKSAYQTAFHLKRELQLYLPFADQWLAVGSFNHHQSVLAEKYGFKLQNVEKSQSGCIGFGFERFTYALYCQFGFLPTAWPVALK